MTEVLLKEYSAYNIMDDDSVQGLKAKLEKSKLFGCNEEQCMREISKAINADEVITGTIEEKDGKYVYSFKNNQREKKGSENLAIKSLVDGYFTENQKDYFAVEITRKLMNPNYAINFKDAPATEDLGDFRIIDTVKDLKEIKLPEIKGPSLDLVKQLRNVTIAEADAAFKKKDYKFALDGFRDARDTLERLSPEEKKKAGSMATDVQNRIYLVGDTIFSKRIEELEAYYKENSPMTLKAVKKGKGFEGWVSLYTDYLKTLEAGERNPPTEKLIAKRVVELGELRDRLLMEKEEKAGDEKMSLGKYDSAISYYGDALDVVYNSQGFLGEKERVSLERKLAEVEGKRWDPEMERVYEKIEKKSEEYWKEGKYEDYIEYLKKKINTLHELTDKGGTKKELVESISKKIDTYGDRLKAERKMISDRISLYQDAARVDESYNSKIQRENEKEILREAQLNSYLYPRSFSYPAIHFPGAPQEEMHKYKYGTSGIRGSIYALASYASFLSVGAGIVLYQVNYGAYLRVSDYEPSIYYLLSGSDRVDLSLLLLYDNRQQFNRAYDKQLESAAMINGGIGFFGFLILLSNIDLTISSKINESSVKRDSIPLYNFEKGSLGINARMNLFNPIQRNLGSEMMYNLEYTYHF